MLAAATRPGIAVLTGHASPVNAVAFSPDGRTLASGGSDGGDGAVRLWDVATRRQIGGPLTGLAGRCCAVAFSPDGTTLASGGGDGKVRLWNVATRRQIGGPLTGPDPVNAVAFSPDGTTLATGGDDRHRAAVGRGHPQADRRPAHRASRRRRDVTDAVAFSRDGRILASGDGDGAVRLWDVATRRPIGGPLTGHAGAVNAVAFSRDGRTLASGGDDGTVRLWDVATRRQIGGPLTGHTGAVLSVAFSPDGRTLASGGQDGTVRLWDVATRRPDRRPAHRPHQPGARRWRSARTARPWPAAATMAPCGCGMWPAVPVSPPSAAASARPRWRSAGTAGPWPAAARMARCGCGTWPPAGRSAARSPATPARSTRWRSARTAGPWPAGGSDDASVRLWDVATGRQIGPVTGHPGAGLSVAFSPDGRTLASGDFEGTVRLWDVATGRQVGSPLTGHTGRVLAVAFSRDGRTLASGGEDGTVRLWDVATAGRSAARSPVTPARSSRWRSARMAGPWPAAATMARCGCGTWPPAGRSALSPAIPAAVLSVAFSPDGRTLASGDDDGLVRLWNVAYLVDIVPRLCASAGRSLTRTEWTRYAPGTTYRSICPESQVSSLANVA